MVEFTILDMIFGGLVDSKIKKISNSACAPIVEIAVVKIQSGKICEHYTNFIGFDDLNAENLFDDAGHRPLFAALDEALKMFAFSDLFMIWLLYFLSS